MSVVDKKTMRAAGVDQPTELARLTGMHGIFGKQIDYSGGDYGQAILSKLWIFRCDTFFFSQNMVYWKSFLILQNTLEKDPVDENKRIA